MFIVPFSNKNIYGFINTDSHFKGPSLDDSVGGGFGVHEDQSLRVGRPALEVLSIVFGVLFGVFLGLSFFRFPSNGIPLHR